MRNSWVLGELPLSFDIETREILKKLPLAHAALAELKGIGESIPDQNILINTLAIQEAKDSSEVENIITTHDELFAAEVNKEKSSSPASKEVLNYVSAMKRGFGLISEQGFISSRTILQIQSELEKNSAGFRKVPGTVLRSNQGGKVIYEPPQNGAKIISLMSNLEKYINDFDRDDFDVITKMAIIHFQFESIHPFYDGNGRTGRILNILYLILQKQQSLPILYLSKYVIQNKSEYYKYLQIIRDENNWEPWIQYIINAVIETANDTTKLIKNIKSLMNEMKVEMRSRYKFYSHDLINNIFRHPYTKVEFLVEELSVSKNTAMSYLNKLVQDGFLHKEKKGYSNFYVNTKLYKLLENTKS
ncbi:MAG: Fic family protein [Fibrobacteria bacterium]|nr:Fic family protein [Fibrobacteria bacterium]